MGCSYPHVIFSRVFVVPVCSDSRFSWALTIHFVLSGAPKLAAMFSASMYLQWNANPDGANEGRAAPFRRHQSKKQSLNVAPAPELAATNQTFISMIDAGAPDASFTFIFIHSC